MTDAPAPELVDELSAVWLRTGGDLREVTRALFLSERFHDPAHMGAKIKSPFELVANAYRVAGADIGLSRETLEVLRALGQLPYNEPAPTGFPAMSADWVNSGALLARMNFALDLAGGRIGGVRADIDRLFPVRGEGALRGMLGAVLPGVDARELERDIAAEVQAMDEAGEREKGARALGLALGSPAFQRR